MFNLDQKADASWMSKKFIGVVGALAVALMIVSTASAAEQYGGNDWYYVTDSFGNPLLDQYGNYCVHDQYGNVYGMDLYGNLYNAGHCAYTQSGWSNIPSQPGSTYTPQTSYCPPGFDSSTCQLLGAASNAMNGAQAQIDELERQGITTTSGGLMERCLNYDVQACEQYQRQADNSMRQMDSFYGPGSGWAESFGLLGD